MEEVMKRFVLIVLSLLLTLVLYAQTDTTRNLTLRNHNDTVSGQPQNNLQYRSEDLQKVDKNQVPSGLRKTLSADKYDGWESQALYYDTRRQIYLLEKKEGITTHVFRFNKDGQPISGMFNEEKDDDGNK